MAQTSAGAPESRIIRVFLSSTFRDFMEERDLLVRQVFPELRRKARERGVEVVDVDLRWGITEEESRQGKVIPICLGEIDRCRPYFVGMLGERYGWIPPSDQYSPEVIERQPWLTKHLGGVSVTELEILHGVLNDPAMAGRAFFYFRDPAWSTSQSEPGFVSETAEEDAKLTDLKQRIRNSGFPVAENLPDPKALADQIGCDLWELIEQQYPDLDEADALEREERQHTSYRRSRLGVYLGGKCSINQLERWIDAGQQKILITGESGAGKSALIANWIEVHRQNHPEDVVFAHHLGCSNDASAIRPLLARLIDTAKQQLPEVYGYSLSVPQDWWELVAKTAQALQSLGRWAQQNSHRWIWVLDGLDRLDSDDQNALPWLPLTIPDGVVVVASGLECPARKILLERNFKTLSIAPLKAKEQEALIQQYLGRYAKQLIAELRQSILSHALAGSPLFLRVLLEELRQCGRYETLADQLAGYLSAETIDDLYERVLERLEADCNTENVSKVMTALWASRAGLSEEELLSITELTPLQWAPIGLALEEALSRNGNRLALDHEYLQKTVKNRYLPDKEDQRGLHIRLSEWAEGHLPDFSPRKSKEYPWQLFKAANKDRLRCYLLDAFNFASMIVAGEDIAVERYWKMVARDEHERLDAALLGSIGNIHALYKQERTPEAGSILISALTPIGDALERLGMQGEVLVAIRSICTQEVISFGSKQQIRLQLFKLANCQLRAGKASHALTSYIRLMHQHYDSLDRYPCIADIKANMAVAYQRLGKTDKSIALHEEVLRKRKDEQGELHPDTLSAAIGLAAAKVDNSEYSEALLIYHESYCAAIALLGRSSSIIAAIYEGMGVAFHRSGRYSDAREYYKKVLLANKTFYGNRGDVNCSIYKRIIDLFREWGKWRLSINLSYWRLTLIEQIHGPRHIDASSARCDLASLLSEQARYDESILLWRKELKLAADEDQGETNSLADTLWHSEKAHSAEIDRLETMHRLGEDLYLADSFNESLCVLQDCLERRQRILGFGHGESMATLVVILNVLSALDRHREAISIAEHVYRCIVDENGSMHPYALLLLSNQASLHHAVGEHENAETLYRRCLHGLQQVHGADHADTMSTAYNLAKVLSQQKRSAEAIPLRRLELEWCREQNGDTDPGTLTSINELAIDLRETGELEEAEALFRELAANRQEELDPDDFEIGRALVGLAKTLEAAGRLEEALIYNQKALDHRQTYEGIDAWCTNRERLDLARVLEKLGRHTEASALLTELQDSMSRNKVPDDADRQLVIEAEELASSLEKEV